MLVVLSSTLVSAQLASPLHRLDKINLVVHSEDGTQVLFKTVVVRKFEDLRQGLMHVKHLPENESMLFLYDPPRNSSMWMKNTYISLDMWWLDTNWRIAHIKRDTEPLSLESLSYEHPVRAVIETNAGLTNVLGIQIGDRIQVAVQ